MCPSIQLDTAAERRATRRDETLPVGLYNFRTHRRCVRRRIGGCGVKLQRLKGEVDNPPRKGDGTV